MLSFQAGWRRTKLRLSFFLHPTTSVITSFSTRHIIYSRQASWSSLTTAIHAISTSSSSFVIIRIRVPHISRLFERLFDFKDLLTIWPFAPTAYFFNPRTQTMHQQLTACPILFFFPSMSSFHCRYVLDHFLCVYCGDLHFFDLLGHLVHGQHTTQLRSKPLFDHIDSACLSRASTH